jgi:hypothetical protein
MDRETRGWLVGVPFKAEDDTRHTHVRLSPRHRWELANLTGVMMASTVFFLTPLLVSAPAPDGLGVAPSAMEGDGPAPNDADRAELAHPRALTTADAESMAARSTDASLPLRPAAAPASARTPRSVSRRSSHDALTLRRSAPSVRSARLTVAVNTTPAATKTKQRDRRRKGLSGGLLRVLVGSGRHRVQPFPTPAAEE